jgi:hypothetical protein
MGRIGGFERDWSPEALKLDVFLEEFPVAGKNLKIERNRILLTELYVGLSAEQASMVLQDLIYVLQVLITMYVSHSLTVLQIL